jgi:hypothetical protein
MMNAPTIAENRPVLELVTETNTGTSRLRIVTILFPGIVDPISLLFDFIQIHIPHLRVVI